jgi:hypothetical protein
VAKKVIYKLFCTEILFSASSLNGLHSALAQPLLWDSAHSVADALCAGILIFCSEGALKLFRSRKCGTRSAHFKQFIATLECFMSLARLFDAVLKGLYGLISH